MANPNQLKLLMTPTHLFMFLLLTQQFLYIHSYIVLPNNDDQINARHATSSNAFLIKNPLANLRSNQFNQLLAKYIANSESSSDDADLQPYIPSTIQRRFCCMSPLSGRKRFIRSLLRRQE